MKEEYLPEMLTWDDLVGPQEIAELLSVKLRTVHMWTYRTNESPRRRNAFPPPSRIISSVPLWAKQEIMAWADASGRLQPDGLEPI